MDDRELELLLELAVASRAEKGDALAPAPAGCLPMGRLARLGETGAALTPEERAHLRSCSTCAARLRAFGGTGLQRHPGRPWRRWIGAAALAAAAGLLVMVVSPWLMSGGEEPVTPPSLHMTAPPGPEVCIDHIPDALETTGKLAFRVSADRDCVVMALVRAWSADCDCLAWHLHRWDDPHAGCPILSTLTPGEARSLDLELAAPPAAGQLLVLVTAPSPEDLPREAAEADALLACLGSTSSCEPTESDAERCLAAVPDCLPASVSVVGQPIVIR